MDTNVNILQLLSETAIFRGFSDFELTLIQEISSVVKYNAGDTIFHHGSSSTELYVIAGGEVDIRVDQSLVSEQIGQGMLTIATVRRGEAFGEIALVDEDIRSAAARCALPDTQVIVIPRQRLIDLSEEYPYLGYKLMRNLAQDLATIMRMRTTDMQMREWLTWSRGNPHR